MDGRTWKHTQTQWNLLNDPRGSATEGVAILRMINSPLGLVSYFIAALRRWRRRKPRATIQVSSTLDKLLANTASIRWGQSVEQYAIGQ
jgi:hypothetical protein